MATKTYNPLLPAVEAPTTSSEFKEEADDLPSPGWGRRGRKALIAAVVAFGLLSLLLVWPTAGGSLRSKSGVVVLQANSTGLNSTSNVTGANATSPLSLCAANMIGTNAWAPGHGADVNIDDDASAATVSDQAACVAICEADTTCNCAVYYDNSPLPAAWPHGNKRCWRRGSCWNTSMLTADPGYSTCIFPPGLSNASRNLTNASVNVSVTANATNGTR